METTASKSTQALTISVRGRRSLQGALDWLFTRQPLWRNGAYVSLWLTKIVSETGSQMSTVAFPLLALLLTHSAAVAGAVGALRLAPYLLLSLPAGALVDRWDRRKVMLVCDAGRALALGSIPLALALGHLGAVQLCVVAAVEGTLFVFFDLAELAALPTVVSQEQLGAASAQYLALTDGVTTLAGPALGGAVFALGRALPFLGDAISYAVSVVTLTRIRFPQQERSEGMAALNWRAIVADIREAAAWLWKSPLRALVGFFSVSNLLMEGQALLVIALAQREGASASEIGLILAIGGAGAIGGALFAERLAARFSFHQLFLPLTWALVPLWLLYAITPTPLLLGVVMGALGAAVALINVTQFTYRMALIPEQLQGRVNSVIRLLGYGGLPIGVALTGLVIQSFGAVACALIFGGGMLALMVVATLTPSLRGKTTR